MNGWDTAAGRWLLKACTRGAGLGAARASDCTLTGARLSLSGAIQQKPSAAAAPQVPESLPAGAEARVAFLPHSPPLLLFASPCLGAAALLFDAAAGTQLRALQLPAPATSLAASPRGGWVAFGLESGDVMVADAEGEASALLTGHVRAAGALAFAAGGELVSGAGDSMWVWQPDPARGRARQ